MFAVTGEATPRVISFDASAPGTLLSSANVSGLGVAESILGIDKRPETATIYALTADGANRSLRTLDPASGALGAPITLTADPADATSPYGGFDAADGVGVDFNPVPDRLRIVTGTNSSLRVNPATGLVITDADLNPGDPQVVAAAYANNFDGAVTTTLYDYDFATNSLTIQNPPNNGTLSTVGAGTGIVAASATDVGFDILTFSGPTTNVGYLLANNSQYTLNLTTGVATLVGQIADGSVPVRDITVSENLMGFVVSASGAVEDGGKVQLVLARQDPRGTATVDYATSDGSAAAGSDFQAAAGTVSFSPGTTTKVLEIPISDDAAAEGAESFSVTLSNAVADPGNSAVVFGSAATVAIADNDPAAVPASDRDSDGVPDASDNCPTVANAGQEDPNANGVGTACDLAEAPAPQQALTNANFAARYLSTLTGKRVTSRSRLVPTANGSAALLTVLCRSSSPCAARYQLFIGKGKRRKLGGSRRVSVPAGEARTVVVRLSRAGRAALRKARTAPARLTVALSDTAGHKRTDASAFVLTKRRQDG